MEVEGECDTEVVIDGPFVDTEPLDLGFETELLDELDSARNELVCGAVGEEVALDSEDEMIGGTEEADVVVHGLSAAGIDGRFPLGEVELNKRSEFDAIRADERNAGEGVSQSQAPGDEQDLVRATYGGSHELAEPSEEDALKFVDRFLELSGLSLSPKIHCARTIKKSPDFPSAKGIRDVAKRISSSRSIQGTETFDWVYTPPTKEASSKFRTYCKSSPRKCLNKMRSLTKGCDASVSGSVENVRFINLQSQNVVSVDSHSESVPHGLEVHGNEVNSEQLVNLDEHRNGENSDQLLSSVSGGETAEAFDIGFCTQMAAEAMEALSHAAPSISPLFYQDPQSTCNGFPKDEKESVSCLNRSPKMVYARSRSNGQLPAKRLGTSAASPEHHKRQKKDAILDKSKKVKTESPTIEKSVKRENISRSRRAPGSSAEPKRQRSNVRAMRSDIKTAVNGHVGISPPPSNTSSQKRESLKHLDGDEQRGVISAASGMAKNLGVNNHEQTDDKIDLSGLVSGLGTWKYPRGKRTKRNSRRMRSGDIHLHPAIKGKQNGSSSKKSISRTGNCFSNNDVRINLHQLSRHNIPLPSENEMGGGLLKQKNSSKSVMLQELTRLGMTESVPDLRWKNLRKRRHMALVRVLFSLHLDPDIVMQQKKILKRLGISTASSSEDATHFIADIFSRTRNMLEAIALGKPVVTPLWLESCGQAGCLIDERNFILRDAKKEKELGFDMPASLANARQYPILKGRKVFITKSVTPSKEMLTSLVKAVHGQAIEEKQISTAEDGNIPVDVLIISCDEDQKVCAPLLKKGARAYSPELILSGVVTQKLEYERHELFKAESATNYSGSKLIKTKKAPGHSGQI